MCAVVADYSQLQYCGGRVYGAMATGHQSATVANVQPSQNIVEL
jgi:hypothetical protein